MSDGRSWDGDGGNRLTGYDDRQTVELPEASVTPWQALDWGVSVLKQSPLLVGVLVACGLATGGIESATEGYWYLLLVGSVAFLIQVVSTYSVAWAMAEPDRPGVRTTIWRSLTHLPSLLVAVLFITLGILFSVFVLLPTGTMGLIVLFISLVVVCLRFALVPAAIVVGGEPVNRAVHSSWQVSKVHSATVFSMLILVTIAGGIVSLSGLAIPAAVRPLAVSTLDAIVIGVAHLGFARLWLEDTDRPVSLT